MEVLAVDSSKSLYQLLIDDIKALKPIAKQSLQRLYEQFSQGLSPNTQDYQLIMQDNTHALLCIDSHAGMITSCFGCQSSHYINDKKHTTTEHVIEWSSANVFAWCIWDAFFITKLVGKSATIRTVDPINNTKIKIEFDGTAFNCNDCWFSFPLGDTQMNESIRACFCCRTKAFTNPQNAQIYANQYNCEVVDMTEMLARTQKIVMALA